MEVMTPPPSPPQDFMIDVSASAGAYSPEPAVTNPFVSADDTAAGNPFLATAAVTAPPSPNPFEHIPPAASDPFDLFQHFTSAPASPARAAAIYAQFDGDDGHGNVVNDDDDGFQPRVSYSTVTSTVPFEWEEKPGKPKKAEFASVTAATADGDTDFDFGVLLDKAAQQTQELTTADELFDDGKIRPLKPPPRLLLDGGSVGSSPRSARSMIWSPRLRGTRGRSTVGPGGADLDPFAAALEKAAKAPSPLGVSSKDNAGGVSINESASSPMNQLDSATSQTTSTPPTNNSNGGRKKWRLSDLLLFRRASSAKGRAAGGNVSRDPVFKYATVQQLAVTPVKDANDAESVAANGDASSVKPKKQSKKAAASTAAERGMPTQHRQSVMGCVRLHPGLHRLAKGFNGHSVHLGGRGSARSAMKG